MEFDLIYEFIDGEMNLDEYVSLMNISKVKNVVDDFTDETVSAEWTYKDYVREYLANEIYILINEKTDKINYLVEVINHYKHI